MGLNSVHFLHGYSESFADIQILRYELKGFEQLSLRQKKLIYYLSKAALSGRDITTDQHGKYNLLIRRVLEIIYTNYDKNKDSEDFLAFETYLKQVWFASGIHHHYSCLKFKPQFSAEFLFQQMKLHEDALHRVLDFTSVETLYDTISPIIFDDNIQVKMVDKSPGVDMAICSAVNYYERINQEEVEQFYNLDITHDDEPRPVSAGLNSRLVKNGGKVCEEVWRVGGRYSAAIERIVYWLRKAEKYAENSRQKEVVRLLTAYYETGDLKLFDDYNIAWVKETEGVVDFINGFIEVYDDPFGLKGTWEGLVHYIDNEATHRTTIISSEAQWFEDHSPVDARFKKETVKGVSARVVNAAMLGGDEYPATAIGINLPNSDWIRAEYGSKSITLSNITQAYDDAALGNGFLQEFVADEATLEHIKKFDSVCNNLHTDLHECLGHGSGKLLPGVSPNALKAYADTIEEARADLFALYYLADSKLQELNLLADATAYRAHYYTYMMNGALTQLARIDLGQQIEEAHMRNRAIIVHWVLDHYPDVARIEKADNGKTYVQIFDYEALRQAFATLLREIQRIKSEGDYDAAKLLVETYGVSIDQELHKEIRTRYQSLNIMPYKGFLNPRLKEVINKNGEVTDIVADYSETFAEQMLRYSTEYAYL